MNEPNGTGILLLAIGGLLMIGLATNAIGRRTPLPRVTLLLLFGIVIGESGLDLVPDSLTRNFDLIADMALLMVGFLLGERLVFRHFAASARRVLLLVLGESLGAALLVLAALLLLGVPLSLAALLAGIAAASAPAATLDVVQEERAAGPFTETLLEIVALDDVVGLLIFSLALAFALASEGQLNGASPLLSAARDIGGAVLVGAVVGVPAAFLSGRIEAGQPQLVEALAAVFFCGGLALTFQVSFLIAAISMGVVVANLARHHERPFHAIEGVEWPFMILFFALAGAALELGAVLTIGVVGTTYVVARGLGRVAGCWCGAVAGRCDRMTRRYMGLALLPQAGVAMGMALVAASHLPQYRQFLLSIVISTTVLFELFSPLLTRRALRLAGESAAAATDRDASS